MSVDRGGLRRDDAGEATGVFLDSFDSGTIMYANDEGGGNFGSTVIADVHSWLSRDEASESPESLRGHIETLSTLTPEQRARTAELAGVAAQLALRKILMESGGSIRFDIINPRVPGHATVGHHFNAVKVSSSRSAVKDGEGVPVVVRGFEDQSALVYPDRVVFTDTGISVRRGSLDLPSPTGEQEAHQVAETPKSGFMRRIINFLKRQEEVNDD